MILHVLKHPCPETLAECREAPDGTLAPEGYEVMTVAEFEAWCDAERTAGWTPGQSAPENPVPVSVTPLQMRRALNASGLRSAVEAAVAGADQDTRDAWEFASEVLRTDPLLNGMAQQLNMTAEQVDQLFILAALS